MSKNTYHVPFSMMHLSKEEIINNLLKKIEEQDEELDKLYSYLETLPVDLEDILK